MMKTELKGKIGFIQRGVDRRHTENTSQKWWYLSKALWDEYEFSLQISFSGRVWDRILSSISKIIKVQREGSACYFQKIWVILKEETEKV